MNKQPNSNYCFVCVRKNPRGLHMTFYANGTNEVVSEYSVSEDYQGYPGMVHGGVVAAKQMNELETFLYISLPEDRNKSSG